MKKGVLKIVTVYVCVSVLAGLLLNISQNVQILENNRKSLERSIQHEYKTIEMLEAEWAFLSRPERLSMLARDVLGWEPYDSARVVGTMRAFADYEPEVVVAGADVPVLMLEEAAVQSVPVPLAKPINPIRSAAVISRAEKQEVVSITPKAGSFEDLLGRLGGDIAP